MSDQEILKANFAKCTWPGLYYGIVPTLAADIGAHKICEVGVAYGYHAADILKTLPEVSYHGIDPYLAGYDPKDMFAGDVAKLFRENDQQRGMDRLHNAVWANLAEYGSRAQLVRKCSTDAAADFADGYFDVIFIDGDHTYEAVKADLGAWWDKLRDGGWFCGDDYVWADVKRAVDEFAAAKGGSLSFLAKREVNYPIWALKK